MNPDANHCEEYRLDLGGVVIALHCREAGLAAWLEGWFGLASVGGEPHVVLDFAFVPHDDEPRLPRSLLTSKRLGPDGSFDIADGLIAGSFNAATGKGSIRAKALLKEGRFPRILEQTLYQAHVSARRRAGLEGWLIHSSAVIVGGQGFLFVGPSGSGKSTVVELSRGLHVLNDEMNLVVPESGGLDLVGTPFNGTFRGKRPGRAPLRAVLLLSHALRHEVTDAPAAEAVATLAGEIVPLVGLDEVTGPHTLPQMVDAAATIAAGTALKVLHFKPDHGFWNPLAAAFGLAAPRFTEDHGLEGHEHER